MRIPAPWVREPCCVLKLPAVRRFNCVLAEALIALPPGAWRYGRVIAVAESPLASRKDRPKVRRNLEAIIQRLNDLGIVVEEWPTR